jgi:sortase A
MKVLANVFMVVGMLALGYWSFLFVSARRYQAEETRRFVTEHVTDNRAEPASLDAISQSEPSTTEAGLYPSTGSAVAMLAIPRLGLSAIVVEGAEERELKLGPGHIPGTSLPGDGGNVGLAGHRDTFFRQLRLIQKDDEIRLSTHEQEYQYKVVSTEIVGPDNVQVLHPIGHETLTLVTCYPFDFVGPAPKRFIVRADCANCPQQKPIQTGGGR